jgi:hypothetical protein
MAVNTPITQAVSRSIPLGARASTAVDANAIVPTKAGQSFSQSTAVI